MYGRQSFHSFEVSWHIFSALWAEFQSQNLKQHDAVWMHHCLQLQWWLVFQVQEFEEEFEKITGGKPTQTRFMRSQQDLKVKMEEQAAAAAGDGGDDEGKQI